VATTSKKAVWGSMSIAPSPPRPSKKPKPRNIIGTDRGERSTNPDAKAGTVRTTAITPMTSIKSDTPHFVAQVIT